MKKTNKTKTIETKLFHCMNCGLYFKEEVEIIDGNVVNREFLKNCSIFNLNISKVSNFVCDDCLKQ